MATDLRRAVTDRYHQASRLTRGKKEKERVYVYVEGDEDKLFWRFYLDGLDLDLAFIIDTYKVQDKTLKGKDKMMQDVCQNLLMLGSNSLICIDSDLDLIIDNYHTYTSELRCNPYVINTCWYSIENLKCHPCNLTEIAYKVTLSDYIDIKLDKSFEEVSILYADLFLTMLVSCELKDTTYQLNDFGSDISRLDFETNGDIKLETKEFIQSRIEFLSAYRAANIEKIKKMEERLSDMGYTRINYYKLMRGHDIEEHLAWPLLCRISYPQRKKETDKIANSKDSRECKKQMHDEYCNKTGVKSNSGIRIRIQELTRDINPAKQCEVNTIIMSQLKTAIKFGRISIILDGLIANVG